MHVAFYTLEPEKSTEQHWESIVNMWHLVNINERKITPIKIIILIIDTVFRELTTEDTNFRNLNITVFIARID